MNDLYYVEVTFFLFDCCRCCWFRARIKCICSECHSSVFTECWEANENISTRETMKGSQKHGTTCILCQRLNSSLSYQIDKTGNWVIWKFEKSQNQTIKFGVHDRLREYWTISKKIGLGVFGLWFSICNSNECFNEIELYAVSLRAKTPVLICLSAVNMNKIVGTTHNILMKSQL